MMVDDRPHDAPLAFAFSQVIDAHAHIGVSWPEFQVSATVADAVGMMDRCGIEKACSSASRYLRFDFQEGNRVTLAACREFPDRVLGFCVADARRPALTLDELDRYLGDEGFVGIKLHVSHTRVSYDDPRHDPIYERAAEHRVPVLAHTFSVGEVAALMAAAARFPDVPFIVGHSGGYAWSECIETIAAQPNAYFDLCCSCVDAGRAESFVAAAGAERVLLGTDLPFLAPSVDVSQVLSAALTAVEKGLILGGNITRILGDRL